MLKKTTTLFASLALAAAVALPVLPAMADDATPPTDRPDLRKERRDDRQDNRQDQRMER